MNAVTQPSADRTVNGCSQGSVAKVQGSVVLPTLLGRAAPRIPVGGRIRAGIKVLTKKADAHAKARDIYERGVEAGKGFETIEKEIKAALPELDNPLIPRNVPYFTVRGEDFPNPEVARQILEKYGEDKGEGTKLYRFPVVFPADAWQNVMPHEMVAWGTSQKLFWSEYSPDGMTRYCKTYEAVPVDGQGRRALRIFGGRKVTLRSENEGRCDPEACPEYQSKRCNLSGRFIFYIPGIQSLSAFELATNSFYAMQAAIEKFQTIGFMRGGRISGFLDGKHTPFFITKRLVEVSRIDDAGKATRVAQWLIELEAPIDVSALLAREDGLESLEMRAAEAAAVLESGPRARQSMVVDEAGEILDPAPVGRGVRRAERVASAANQQPVAAVPRQVGAEKAADDGAEKAPPKAASRATPRTTTPLRSDDGKGGGDTGLAWILDAAAALGVPGERFEAFAEKRWGKGWKLAQGGRKRALDELSSFEDDAKGFKEKVDGELDIWN
jgi:hypothetical protein